MANPDKGFMALFDGEVSTLKMIPKKEKIMKPKKEKAVSKKAANRERRLTNG